MTMIGSCTETFTEQLFRLMKEVEPGIEELDLYEFRYGLNNLIPPGGWESVIPVPKEELEQRICSRALYDGIRIKDRQGDKVLLDKQIVHLTHMLFAGLVCGAYDINWVRTHFYFDVRSFFFFHRTQYFTEGILAHFGGKPFRQFPQNQKRFERQQDLGYKAFREANADLDACLIDSALKLTAAHGTPVVLAIAGPTAAGKTEIVERLRTAFEGAGRRTTSIELDNFLTDRDYREEKGIFTQGKEALHFELFKQCLRDITAGKKVFTPRYDFINATSSHDLAGHLKPDGIPVEIEPADIIFIEGNFPFLVPDVVDWIGIKVVYLTDDPIRLKRKWKRDIDYRMKYEPTYFRNRFFKDQFIMAEIAFRPQMEVCDLTVDTTGGALWATPEVAQVLTSDHPILVGED